jgi:hypothetical protein
MTMARRLYRRRMASRPRAPVVQCASRAAPSASHLPNEHGDAQPFEEPDKSLGDYSRLNSSTRTLLAVARTPLPSMKTTARLIVARSCDAGDVSSLETQPLPCASLFAAGLDGSFSAGGLGRANLTRHEHQLKQSRIYQWLIRVLQVRHCPPVSSAAPRPRSGPFLCL